MILRDNSFRSTAFLKDPGEYVNRLFGQIFLALKEYNPIPSLHKGIELKIDEKGIQQQHDIINGELNCREGMFKVMLMPDRIDVISNGQYTAQQFNDIAGKVFSKIKNCGLIYIRLAFVCSFKRLCNENETHRIYRNIFNDKSSLIEWSSRKVYTKVLSSDNKVLLINDCIMLARDLEYQPGTFPVVNKNTNLSVELDINTVVGSPLEFIDTMTEGFFKRASDIYNFHMFEIGGLTNEREPQSN